MKTHNQERISGMHQPTTNTVYHMIVPPRLKRTARPIWPWFLVGVAIGLLFGSAV